jgi:methionine-rich copper-binding protein CopC
MRVKKKIKITLKLFLYSLFSIPLLLSYSSNSAYAHGNSPVIISPTPYSTLPKFPAILKIDFTDALNTKTGSIELLDPSGKDILTEKNITIQSVTAKINPALYKGQYQLNYQLLSLDGTTLEKSVNYTIVNGDNYIGKVKFKKSSVNTSKPVLPILFFLTLPLIYIIFVKINSKKQRK